MKNLRIHVVHFGIVIHILVVLILKPSAFNFSLYCLGRTGIFGPLIAKTEYRCQPQWSVPFMFFITTLAASRRWHDVLSNLNGFHTHLLFLLLIV